MADSPIRISIELDGIESNDRLNSAVAELAASADELLEQTSEVSGHAYDLNPNDVNVFKRIRPGVLGFQFGDTSSWPVK